MMILCCRAVFLRCEKKQKRVQRENYSEIADSTAEVQSDRSDLGIGKTRATFYVRNARRCDDDDMQTLLRHVSTGQTMLALDEITIGLQSEQRIES